MNDDGLNGVGMAAALAKSYADDAHGFLPALAGFLEGTMPEAVEVERKAISFFSSKKRVVGLKLTLGDYLYSLHEGHKDGILEAHRSKIVRGVTLKTETVPVGTFLDNLSSALTEHSKQSETAYYALKEFLKQ
ncbi:MAG TPA: hypothetical protein VGO93_22175 [Candidatus Xenobia bacterium]